MFVASPAVTTDIGALFELIAIIIGVVTVIVYFPCIHVFAVVVPLYLFYNIKNYYIFYVRYLKHL